MRAGKRKETKQKDNYLDAGVNKTGTKIRMHMSKRIQEKMEKLRKTENFLLENVFWKKLNLNKNAMAVALAQWQNTCQASARP